MRSWLQRPTAKSAFFLALGFAMAAAAGPAAMARPASGGDVIWLKVEVHDASSSRANVKLNVPLSLIEVVIDSIDKREFMANLQDEHHLDLPKLWREVRGMNGSDFVTVETDEENIRVWKDNDFFRIDVDKIDGKEGEVQVKLPLAIMDYLFESRRGSFDFAELVDQLRGHLPVTLVQMQDDDHSVKIWIEEQ